MFHGILKEHERRSRLFGAMLRRFWFDTRRDMNMCDAAMLSRADSQCRSCTVTDRCEAWMASSEGTEGADHFCPNAAAFSQLRGPTGP